MNNIPDFFTHLPSGSESTDVATKYGAIGDFIGGFWGTAINLIGLTITIFFVYRTFSITRKTEIRSKIFEIFSEMVRTHDSITDSFRYSNQSGRDVFRIILREFSSVYKIVLSVDQAQGAKWTIKERIDVAFTFVSFGPTRTAISELSAYELQAIKNISNDVARLRDKATTMKKGEFLRGHQGRLSSYYRNLYGILSFIDSSPLDKSDKRNLAKVVRAKLGNHEQGLLALNIISHFGRSWEDNGFLGRYNMIKNIPEEFFSFDRSASIEKLFPYISYEWRAKKPVTSNRGFRIGKNRIFVYIVRTRK